jgi:biopolymer transport protein ExbD
MKFRSRHSRERTMMFDLTPMIDIVFLLIIFFLTTAQFSRMTRADVELAIQPGEQEENQDEPGIVINIMSDGAIIVDDDNVGLPGLERIITREIAQHDGRADMVKTLVRADRRLAAGRVNEVVRMLQGLGVRVGRFATETPQ